MKDCITLAQKPYYESKGYKIQDVSDRLNFLLACDKDEFPYDSFFRHTESRQINSIIENTLTLLVLSSRDKKIKREQMMEALPSSFLLEILCYPSHNIDN
jgi:hypothetical protein